MASDPYDSERIRRATARLRISLYVALGFPLTVTMIVALYLLIRGAVGWVF